MSCDVTTHSTEMVSKLLFAYTRFFNGAFTNNKLHHSITYRGSLHHYAGRLRPKTPNNPHKLQYSKTHRQ